MKKLNYNKAKKFYNRAKQYVEVSGVPANISKVVWEFYTMVNLFENKFKRTPSEEEYELMIGLFPKDEQNEIRKFSFLVSEAMDKE